jgi:putative ABC transport system substrate-binding protein
MNRRVFLCGLTLETLVARLAGEAQPVGKVPRIGVLGAASPEWAPHTDALRQGLRELGYVEGQNITSEWRWARGDPKRFPEIAAELVRLNVDVIVADNNPAIAAAQKATRTIPIVMVVATDPVGLGFVASLARPGGNITGLSFQSVEPGKRLQLLRETVPNLSKIAILSDLTEPGRRESMLAQQTAAMELGLQVQSVQARSAGELDSAFTTMTRNGVGGVVIGGSTMQYIHRARIGELAARSRLPTVCAAKGYAEAGCLISYNASFGDLFRRAAAYVDKILKGAKPADLPVEQPTKFELVINLKTAKALGLTIPQSILLRADQVIE